MEGNLTPGYGKGSLRSVCWVFLNHHAYSHSHTLNKTHHDILSCMSYGFVPYNILFIVLNGTIHAFFLSVLAHFRSAYLKVLIAQEQQLFVEG